MLSFTLQLLTLDVQFFLHDQYYNNCIVSTVCIIQNNLAYLFFIHLEPKRCTEVNYFVSFIINSAFGVYFTFEDVYLIVSFK